jgi:histidinol-phosphate aminotransferase
VSARVSEVVANRRRFTEELEVLGLRTPPSAANFVLVPLRGAGDVAARLRARGVAVRPFDGLPPISDALADSGGEALRITIGPWDMMSAALVALREVLAECE